MKVQFEFAVSGAVVALLAAVLLCSKIGNPRQFRNAPGTGLALAAPVQKVPETAVGNPNPPASAAEIMARRQVPILCYHQIRDFRESDSKSARDYIVPPASFREQMKLLHDSGYHTILPGQLLNYLQYGQALPSKPIMLTFDDADADQYSVALPELSKYGFKGVFFVMTVVLNKPRYLSKEQVREIARLGHEVGSHTWDHQNVKKLNTEADWVKQVDKPSAELAAITGKPVRYFAYPFGLWKPEVIPGLRQRHFEAAFQLSARRDPAEPLYTIRRMIVPGTWSAATMKTWMQRNFQ